MRDRVSVGSARSFHEPQDQTPAFQGEARPCSLDGDQNTKPLGLFESKVTAINQDRAAGPTNICIQNGNSEQTTYWPEIHLVP